MHVFIHIHDMYGQVCVDIQYVCVCLHRCMCNSPLSSVCSQFVLKTKFATVGRVVLAAQTLHLNFRETVM